MIDEQFIKYINEGSKFIEGIAKELPKQFHNMKDISPESAKKIQDAITFSDIKGKLQEFQTVKKNLDDALKKFK